MLGAFVQGFDHDGRQFAGGTWDWLTPFSVMTGVGLVCGYGLLGATWCVMKTTGELEIWARRKALRFLLATIVRHGDRHRLGAVPRTRHRGALVHAGRTSRSSRPSRCSPTLRGLPDLPRASSTGRHVGPFLLSIALFLLGFSASAISLFPYIVPPNLTIWQAANTVHSQLFALVGFPFVLPITFGYTAYAYYVFRGKVAEEIDAGGYGYH